jgi:hypothetical protein
MQVTPFFQPLLRLSVPGLIGLGLAVSARTDGIDALVKAYPEFLAGRDATHLIWRDGERMLIDDGKKKDFETLLNTPDLEDQFRWPYPRGKASYAPPAENHDPGRVRYEPLFKKMYGQSAAAVEKNLVSLPWMPKTTNIRVRVSRINGVDKQLAAVSRELDELPPELKKYASKTAGTFNWRPIAGTKRLSTHAFGTAIDLNTDYAHYWKWADGGKKPLKYQNKYPKEIVEIFEKYGFIWGGKWYHYDTMHFEYRPEFLIQTKP